MHSWRVLIYKGVENIYYATDQTFPLYMQEAHEEEWVFSIDQKIVIQHKLSTHRWCSARKRKKWYDRECVSAEAPARILINLLFQVW